MDNVIDLVSPTTSQAAETVDLPVAGMHCASCVRRVESAALAVPGVLEVAVNIATERAHLRVRPGTDLDALATAFRRAGFDVPRTAPAPATERRLDREALSAAAALLLALPLLVFSLPAPLALALAAAVQLIFGARFYLGAFQALRHRASSMDTLVALGTSASFALSVWAVAVGQPRFEDFAAGALVIAFVRLGKWLENRARRHAGRALRDLSDLRPERAHLRVGERERDIPVADLRPGDFLAVRPGERFPADGVIREGTSGVDESLLTGESLPVSKGPGDPVTGGALNGEGLLLVEATALGAESRLSQLVRLVESAGATKLPVQRLVDRVSAAFVLVVIAIAAATLLGWWLAGAAVAAALIHAVSVLVIACPCALGLATPAAIVAGTGVAARAGILISDGSVFERAGRIRHVIFDKTGTLTEGRPALLTVTPPDQPDLLRLAAALAAGSEHPLARALTDASAKLVHATNVRALPGRGVEGNVEGTPYLLGSERLLRERGLDLTGFEPAIAEAREAGRTVSLLAGPNAALALFTFGDRTRATAARTVEILAPRYRLHLLTGDTKAAAHALASSLGLSEVHAEALPEGKLQTVTALRPAVFVGDGVNDAAALAAADIGIAIGTGADIAASSAAITLLRPDPLLVPAALDIAGRTHRRIMTGLFWAFVYNLVGLPLAAFGMLSPAVAGAAMALSSISVVANALLLRTWRP